MNRETYADLPRLGIEIIWAKLLQTFSLCMLPAAVGRVFFSFHASWIVRVCNRLLMKNWQWAPRIDFNRQTLIGWLRSLRCYDTEEEIPMVKYSLGMITEYDHTQWPSCSESYDFVNTCRLIRAPRIRKLLQIRPENAGYWMARKELRTTQWSTTVRMIQVKQSLKMS